MANTDNNQPQRGSTPVPPRGGKRAPNRPSSSGRPSTPSGRAGQRQAPSARPRSAAAGTRTGQAGSRRPGAGSPSERRRQALAQQRRRRQTLLAGGAIVLVIVVVAVLVIIKVTGGNNTTSASGSSGGTYARIPLSAANYKKLASIPPSQLAAAANNFSTGLPRPKAVNDPALTAGGKPDVLYIGAEFCPYCAAERWALTVALSKFGTFDGLHNIHSAKDDEYLPTLTFYKSSYKSDYVTFTPIEDETDTHAQLQKPNAAQTKLWNKYAPDSFPFVDIGGKAVIPEVGYNQTLLSGLTYQQVVDQIAAGRSKLASNVYSAAGAIVSNICHITGGKPGNVCSDFPKPLTS